MRAAEQRSAREIIANLSVEYEPGAAIQSDALENAVDYEQMCQRTVDVVSGGKFKLLETLADRIVKELTRDPRLTSLTLELDKRTRCASPIPCL